jgi:hypothetical protein
MNKTYKIFWPILVFLLLLIAATAVAQQDPDQFKTKEYEGAIKQIIHRSAAFSIQEQVIEALIAEPAFSGFSTDSTGLMSAYFFLEPAIAFVPWDGTVSAVFTYQSSALLDENTLTLDFSDTDDWVNIQDVSIDYVNQLITIPVGMNPVNLARTTSFEAVAIPGGTTLTFTATILQAPAPQQFLIVSPDYYSIGAEGGITESFTVTNFNTGGFEFEFSDEWMQLATARSTDYFNLLIEPNYSSTLREGKVIIYGSDNPAVKDSVLIFQLGQQQPSLIVSPMNNYVSPDSSVLQLQVFSGLAWEAEVLSGSGNMFTALTPNIQSNTLSVSIDHNNTSSSRTGKIRVFANDPPLSRIVNFFQAASYIIINPSEKIVPCQDFVFGVDVIRYATDSIVVDSFSDWLTPAVINNDSVQISVSANIISTLRVGYVKLRSYTNPAIFDSLAVIQYPCSQPYILATPDIQFVLWDQLELPDPFTIWSNQVENIGILTSEGWMTPSLDGDSLYVSLYPNLGSGPRLGFITLYDLLDSNVSALVNIYQGSSLSHIVIDPNFQAVGAGAGQSLPYHIFSLNIDEWEVAFIGPQPAWITNTHISGGQVFFSLAENTQAESRQATFRVRDVNEHAVYGEAIIYQAAASQAVLLASPRQKTVLHTGNPLENFAITSANVDFWQADYSNLPSWITVNVSGQNTLSLNIDENQQNQTRQATIRIFDVENPSVSDSVTVYQYSALDTLLLIAPRQMAVSHFGSDIQAGITAVNIEAWDVEAASLPEWVVATVSSTKILNLTVAGNPTPDTREAVVRVFAVTQPHIFDTMTIYQYSSLNSYLLASPREQLVSYHGSSAVVFDVTAVNIAGWEVDAGTVPSWVTVTNSGSDVLSVEVAPNPNAQLRQAFIRIFATGQSGVEDFVALYQGANPQSYLLVAPRQASAAHTGAVLDFDVTAVNIENWDVDLNNNSWIEVVESGLGLLRLTIAENTLSETRAAAIFLFDVDDVDVRDTAFVYQYSALDSYILLAPRNKIVGHNGAEISFEVFSVNTGNWLLNETLLPGWIVPGAHTPDSMILLISENEELFSRSAVVYVFDENNPGIFDSVQIFQYASPEPLLLLSPREQWVPHTGNDNLVFDVTAVNIDDWTVNTGAFSWITVNSSGAGGLSLNIAPNPEAETRMAVLYVFDSGNPAVYDSVFVYQYSGLQSYLLAAPREKSILHTGGMVAFHITSVNTGNWVISPENLPEWLTPGPMSSDSLRLIISLNTTASTRSAEVYLFDQNNPDVFDSVRVYQSASPLPYILTAPREKKIPHTGSPQLDFKTTLVNVAAWEFTDTSPYDDWISFLNVGDSILRLSVDTNLVLQGRSAKILIQSTDDEQVKDSISVYQFSASDSYILAEPREQLARRYAGDTLSFGILSVNVDSLVFELVENPGGMIDLAASSLQNDTLRMIVLANGSPASREASIRIFDYHNPQVSDTVSIFQNYPFMIVRPAAFANIGWDGDVLKINTYSNIAGYEVRKGSGQNWYQLSRDSLSWGHEPLELMGNDSLYIRVDTNYNAFLRRSSFLDFSFNDEIGNVFWFDQETREGTFFDLIGRVFIEGDPLRPLQGISVALYDSVYTTNEEGLYRNDVPENWIGIITPLIDPDLEVPYYFLPPRIEIIGLGITGDTIVETFAAYKIQPAVTILPASTRLCFGDLLLPESGNYPNISISDTYGSSTYEWTSEPFDEILATNADVLFPVFGPLSTTTYRLRVNNFFRTAEESFTITVNPLPEPANMQGSWVVCSNQAGSLYQVAEPEPGIYYSWELDDDNPGGYFVNSTNPLRASGNIAIVNWLNNPGTYNLKLFAYNEFDCSGSPLIGQIEITSASAPVPSRVVKIENDNMLYSTDSLAASYQWGWFTKNSSGELTQEYIIPGKSEWYCRLPDGHVFNPSQYYYFVIAWNNDGSCGSRTFFNAPVGIPEIQQPAFTVYPNPGKGVFSLSVSDDQRKEQLVVEVFSSSGQLVYTGVLAPYSTEYLIDISRSGNTGAGIYILRVMVGGEVHHRRIIVQ